MPWHKNLGAGITVLVLMLTGCGGGSSSGSGNGGGGGRVPTGPFSNSFVAGSYAFVITGTNALGFFAAAGSFEANGSGAITGGTMDVNLPAGVQTNLAITGSYSILGNGQGTATVSAAGGPTFALHLVVISPRRVLISRMDGNAVGHGDADLQDSTSFAAAITKAQIAYRIFGADASGNPAAMVGGFTTDLTNTLTAGLHDASDNGTILANQALSGSATAASAADGRGTLTLNTSLGILHFAFYVVDAERFKLVETERGPSLAGEMFTGGNGQLNVPGCGPCIFEWTGMAGGSPLGEIGVYLLDDLGNVDRGSFTRNNGGTAANGGFSGGTYSFAPQFRGTLNFGLPALNFAAYPSAVGVQMLELDAGTVVSGTAFDEALAGHPHLELSFDGNFGFNQAGMPFSGEPEEIGQVANADPAQTGAGTSSGFVDVDSGGTVTSVAPLSGNFTMDPNVFPQATGTATLQTPLGMQPLTLYPVTGFAPVLFVSTDPNRVVAGEFEPQSTN